MRIPEEHGHERGREQEGHVQERPGGYRQDQSGLPPRDLLAQFQREERAPDAHGVLERGADRPQGIEQSRPWAARRSDHAHGRITGGR
jgi:hypothetical protein